MRRLLTSTDLIRETDADPNATPRERAMANALDAMVEYLKHHRNFGIHDTNEHRLITSTYPMES